MSFLREIVAETRARLPRLPRGEPGPRAARPRLLAALAGRERLSVVAELKRSSPSRGALAPDADAVTQAARYADAGASAISVLTEPRRFGGSFDDLQEVAARLPLPVLMKDFVLSPEQARVAALLGASAFLVILRLVDDVLLGELANAAREYGLEMLLEIHDAGELERALAVDGAIGVNNRDLDVLDVDRGRALALAERLPSDRVVVAESGYTSPEQTRPLVGTFDGVLIGSALMTATDPGAFLREVTACG